MGKRKSIYGVHPGVLMTQKWIGELKQKTGRTLDEWIKFIRKEGPPTEPARRDWLKQQHQLGTNTAWWLAERSVGKGEESGDPAAYLNNLPLRQLQGIIAAPEESGSWALFLNHYQALWVDHCDRDRTWGVFGMYGISDGNPNPIHFVANVGIGGRSPARCRKYDTFGLGFFYTGLSDDFKELTAPVLAQRDEYGFEAFYNYAITPWCRLTGDLQVARPSTQSVDTTVLLGTRLQILF